MQLTNDGEKLVMYRPLFPTVGVQPKPKDVLDIEKRYLKDQNTPNKLLLRSAIAYYSYMALDTDKLFNDTVNSVRFNGPTQLHVLLNIYWQAMVDILVVRSYDQKTRSPIVNYLDEFALMNNINRQVLKGWFKNISDMTPSYLTFNSGDVPSNGGVGAGDNIAEGGFNYIGDMLVSYIQGGETNRETDHEMENEAD